jgi:aminoglycoside phosphotransferase (APT) family kinase protein
MHRLRGQVIRKQLPQALEGRPDLCRKLSHAVIDNLAALHGLDLHAAGLADFGKPEGYARRQVEGWSKRWLDAQTEDVPEMASVARWLAERMPSAESGASLIHNDYKLDNILVDTGDPTRITGLLDWEMATVGDALMDLGTALSYWIEPTDPASFQRQRFSPTVSPGFVTRQEFLERYQKTSGREVRNPSYYYVYGLFKLAVILQQIYFRYVQGLTQDARFAGFGEVVRGLARQAESAAARDALSG